MSVAKTQGGKGVAKRCLTSKLPLSAVLFQGKREALRVDLTQPQKLADLLNLFFAYTEPEHEDFDKAVAELKERVPDLARGLADKIKAAHRDTAKFQAAFHPGRTSEVQVVRPPLRPSSRRWFTVSTPAWSPLRRGTVFAVVVERAGSHRPYGVV